MSRGGGDGAARLMISCLDALGDRRAPLIVDEPSGLVARALRNIGGAPVEWHRYFIAEANMPAAAWPSGDTCDSALIRLPKSKEALRLALHATASKLPAGAPIVIFGGNAEGIRSADRPAAEVADGVATLATGHHARAIIGRRCALEAALNGHLSAWRHVDTIEIAGHARVWVSYPGTFAKGGLDAGTAFLLRHLPEMPRGARVLDFAAGTGVIAAAIAAMGTAARIDMIDADALAIEAARENVPSARARIGDRLAAADVKPFDLIISNPPVHDGVAESRQVLDRLIADAPRHLAQNGRLVLVVQRRVAVMSALEAAFGAVRVLGDDGRFTVAVGEQPSRHR